MDRNTGQNLGSTLTMCYRNIVWLIAWQAGPPQQRPLPMRTFPLTPLMLDHRSGLAHPGCDICVMLNSARRRSGRWRLAPFRLWRRRTTPRASPTIPPRLSTVTANTHVQLTCCKCSSSSMFSFLYTSGHAGPFAALSLDCIACEPSGAQDTGTSSAGGIRCRNGTQGP